MTLPERARAARRPRADARREHHLDNLKAGLVAAIIAGHAILGYATIGGWPYDAVREVTLSQATQVVLAVVAGPIALFGLGAMFMLAGMMTPGALRRKGVRRFTAQRLLRLGVPFAAFVLLVWPLLLTGLLAWWMYDQAYPVLTMVGVPEENVGVIWLARIFMVGMLTIGCVLIGRAWSRRSRTERPVDAPARTR
jgi:hypothetical protein